MDSKTEEFLQKLKDLGHWNDDYDYSEVKYVNNVSKVIIIDKKYNSKHLIMPSKLISSNTKCFTTNAVDLKGYTIKQLSEIHNNEYDYSLLKFINSKSKIKVICKKHGIFKTTLNNHKNGKKCPDCVGGVGKSFDYYLKKFQEVHGNRYDYSKANYQNSKTPVTIICKEHSEFYQTPSSHLKSNCPSCSGNKQLSTKEVIKKFQEVHGNRYDYSKANYQNSKTPVTIICKEHGEFNQSPTSHKKGNNCPKCVGGIKLYNKSDAVNYNPHIQWDGRDKKFVIV